MDVTWATPLCKFLRQCNASPLTKEVLDCGAGGSEPPLSLFHQFGYRTSGIEIAEEALAEAWTFCQEHDMSLNIFQGDMRCIPLIFVEKLFEEERYKQADIQYIAIKRQR